MGNGFGPITRNLSILLESKQKVADAEREKEEQKQRDEIFKQQLSNSKLQAKALETELKFDSARMEQILAATKREDVQEAERLIRESRGEEALAQTNQLPRRTPVVGLHQEGETLIGPTQDFHRTPEQLAQGEENRQRLLHQREQEAIASAGGQRAVAETNAESREFVRELANRAADSRLDKQHKLRIEVEGIRSRDRRAKVTQQQIANGDTPEGAAAVAKLYDDAIALRSDPNKISDVNLRRKVITALSADGHTIFPSYDEHFEYVKKAGNIKAVLNNADELIRVAYNITQDQLISLTDRAISGDLQDPGTFKRVTALISGMFRNFTKSDRSSILEEEKETKLATGSRELGGEDASRFSDFDLRLARGNFPSNERSLYDNLIRNAKLKGQFQEKFENLYFTLTPEQKRIQVAARGLPFHILGETTSPETSSVEKQAQSQETVQQPLRPLTEDQKQLILQKNPNLTMAQLETVLAEAANADR